MLDLLLYQRLDTMQEGIDSGTVLKMTLHAYFTYAHWSDAYVGQVATSAYPDSNKGVSFGLQMEVWW